MNYFFGRYFKCCGADGAVAFIVARHKNGKKESASLQVITPAGAHSAPFPIEQYIDPGDGFSVRLGENRFKKTGLTLHLDTPDLHLSGELRFGAFAPIKGDVMGPFRFVPFLQCRHSVYSMEHTVNGEVTVNGQAYRFDGGRGYIEGDRGRSFPKEYLWTHCFGDNCSVMLSVAHIPFGALHFTGVIGEVRMGAQSYRIATYRGAKVASRGKGTVVIAQKDLTLTARLIYKNAAPLLAPDRGQMARVIRESVSCTAHYTLTRNGETLLDFERGDASFEYEYSDQ